MKRPHVTILQTSMSRRDDAVAFLERRVPGIRVEFIADSTLLEEAMNHGGPTRAMLDRMILYARAAQISGSDLIVNSSVTFGEAAEIYSREVGVPVMRLDEPMAREACRMGTRIALIATVEASLGPVRRLIERIGSREEKQMQCAEYFIDGAWELFQTGKMGEHDSLILDKIRELDDQGYDAIVMGQLSMRSVFPKLQDIKTPVLGSFASGYQAVADRMNELLRQGAAS